VNNTASLATGELPIRAGLTTVGQAGSPIGIPAEAITSAATRLLTAPLAEGRRTTETSKLLKVGPARDADLPTNRWRPLINTLG
jgi:hypothetical protein